MPRDFLAENSAADSPDTEPVGRDFLMDSAPQGRSLPIQPQEGIGSALWKAPFRVGEDVAHGVMSGLQSLPGYYQAAKTEIPGAFSAVWNHPGHAAMQGLAGGFELVNSLDQAPLNIARYGANRLNLLPQAVPNTISKITPTDSTDAIHQVFGDPKYAGEALLRGIPRNALNIYGAGKLLSALDPAAFLTTKKSLAQNIIDTHDALENKAAEGFKTVSEEVNNRNIPQVPVDPYAIDDLREFFPKTKQANALITNAQTGDYNALRKLQSDLYQKGKDSLKSPLESERMRADEMFEKRNDINQAISDHLVNQGHEDLNQILGDARANYRTLQDIYYNPKMNNAIVNMVDSQSRKIPNNLAKILQEDSLPMQQLRDYHPGLQDNLNRFLLKQNALSILKKYGIPVGLGALGAKAAMSYMHTASDDGQ